MLRFNALMMSVDGEQHEHALLRSQGVRRRGFYCRCCRECGRAKTSDDRSLNVTLCTSSSRICTALPSASRTISHSINTVSAHIDTSSGTVFGSFDCSVMYDDVPTIVSSQ